MFLEGIEIPIVGIQLQGLPNSPLLASIQIPPVAEGTRLLPRTLVHVFFRDPYESVSPHLARTSTGGTTPTDYQTALEKRQASNPEGVSSLLDTELTRYKHFFSGEILGFAWTKDQAQRSLVLQCADLSNYWDYAYQWTNTDLFGPGIKAMFSGGSTNLFTDFLSSSGEVITNILRTPSITFPKLKGLAGGIVHLLEAIGGTYYYDRKIAGQNIFFTLAELRLHINQMIMAIEDDPTTARLLATQGYSGMMSRLLGGMGGQTSIRQSITALQGIIFHETYAQPCPRYVPGTLNPTSAANRVRLADDPSTAFVVSAAQQALTDIGMIKRQLHSTEGDVEASKLAAQAGVRSSLQQQVILQTRKLQSYLKSLIMQLRRVTPAAPKAVSLLTTASQQLGSAGTALARWSPNSTASTGKIEGFLNTAENALKSLSNMTRETAVKSRPAPPRLAQQILRPDVWFSAPPRCNVLFPEHYSRLNYSRNFMEEPTRLLLKTNDEFFGEDELFDRLYFAPKTTSVKKAKADLQAMLQNDLLEHELYTGILPVFEKMGELNIFAARGGVTTGRVAQVGLAQRSANFLYFKYRFASRQMTVSGRFNPYIALGFPGLVIDKYADEEMLRLHNELRVATGSSARDINKLLGTAFLGNFTQVSFVVNNQGTGTTDIVMSYPRQTDEGVEFLGTTDPQDLSVSKRLEQDAVRVTDVASVGQPLIDSLGPNLGRITQVEEVSLLYRGSTQSGDPQDTMSSKPLLLFSKQDSRQPRSPESRKSARVPVGVEVDARDLDKAVLKELGLFGAGANPDGWFGDSQAKNKAAGSSSADQFYKRTRPITIRAYRIREEIPRYRQLPVDLPAEEYIRPGWYGDIWSSARIGEAYDTFFATGAITDPHVIGDPEGQQRAATNNGAADAQNTAAETTDPNSPQKDAPVVYQLEAGATIEQAAGYLQAMYSHIKLKGLDVEEFIRAYTYRPIATLVDIFGTRDLSLSADGAYVLSGVEGFHSRAFGQFNDLFGLVTPEIVEVVGLKRGTTAAQRGDTRKVKQDAVKDYLAGLGLGRAILG